MEELLNSNDSYQKKTDITVLNKTLDNYLNPMPFEEIKKFLPAEDEIIQSFNQNDYFNKLFQNEFAVDSDTLQHLEVNAETFDDVQQQEFEDLAVSQQNSFVNILPDSQIIFVDEHFTSESRSDDFTMIQQDFRVKMVEEDLILETSPMMNDEANDELLEKCTNEVLSSSNIVLEDMKVTSIEEEVVSETSFVIPDNSDMILGDNVDSVFSDEIAVFKSDEATCLEKSQTCNDNYVVTMEKTAQPTLSDNNFITHLNTHSTECKEFDSLTMNKMMQKELPDNHLETNFEPTDEWTTLMINNATTEVLTTLDIDNIEATESGIDNFVLRETGTSLNTINIVAEEARSLLDETVSVTTDTKIVLNTGNIAVPLTSLDIDNITTTGAWTPLDKTLVQLEECKDTVAGEFTHAFPIPIVCLNSSATEANNALYLNTSLVEHDDDNSDEELSQINEMNLLQLSKNTDSEDLDLSLKQVADDLVSGIVDNLRDIFVFGNDDKHSPDHTTEILHKNSKISHAKPSRVRFMHENRISKSEKDLDFDLSIKQYVDRFVTDILDTCCDLLTKDDTAYRYIINNSNQVSANINCNEFVCKILDGCCDVCSQSEINNNQNTNCNIDETADILSCEQFANNYVLKILDNATRDFVFQNDFNNKQDINKNFKDSTDLFYEQFAERYISEILNDVCYILSTEDAINQSETKSSRVENPDVIFTENNSWLKPSGIFNKSEDNIGEKLDTEQSIQNVIGHHKILESDESFENLLSLNASGDFNIGHLKRDVNEDAHQL